MADPLALNAVRTIVLGAGRAVAAPAALNCGSEIVRDDTTPSVPAAVKVGNPIILAIGAFTPPAVNGESDIVRGAGGPNKSAFDVATGFVPDVIGPAVAPTLRVDPVGADTGDAIEPVPAARIVGVVDPPLPASPALDTAKGCGYDRHAGSDQRRDVISCRVVDGKPACFSTRVTVRVPPSSVMTPACTPATQIAESSG